MSTLISFLGKGKSDPKKGYRTAQYRFDDETVRQATFFGLALCQHIKPERVILLGTRGSMWDMFFEQVEAPDEEVLPLIDAVRDESVTSEHLAKNEQHLSRYLGVPVRCVLIPYARTEEEQADILHKLASEVQDEECISLDVTLGFRHLPMLALVAARYLKHLRKIHVEDLYYGALEMTSSNGETPVLRLGGMLAMLDWVDALATYDKDGNYGAFAPLLQQDGMPTQQTEQIRQAAFFERTGNPVKATEKLSGVHQAVEKHEGSLGRLFRQELLNRMSWFRKKTRSERELALSEDYMERGDYLRAATFLYEAYVTRSCERRKANDNVFKERAESFESCADDNAKTLSYLRNSMAHGVRSKEDRHTATLSDENSLRQTLKQLRRDLFNKQS